MINEIVGTDLLYMRPGDLSPDGTDLMMEQFSCIKETWILEPWCDRSPDGTIVLYKGDLKT